MKTSIKNSLNHMKKNLKIVKTIKELKELIQKQYYEYFIKLNYGIFSKKEINYNKKTKKYKITNCIDNTKQTITEKQLINKNITNIGDAITKKALIVNLNKKS